MPPGRPSKNDRLNLAIGHHRAGRLREAEALYRQILARQPKHAVAMHHLGAIAHHRGHNEIAVDLLRRALVLNPNWPEAHSNLGNILRDSGKLDEAVAACRQAIALRPVYAEAHNNLGLALNAKVQVDEAIACYHQAIALRPNFAEAHNNLGNALRNKGQIDEAIVAHRQAIALNPKLPEAYHNLGIALQDNGQIEEAIVVYRQAVALKPNYIKAYINLGNALKENGQLDEAIAAFRRAIDVQADFAEVHMNLAMALLARGDFQEGWQEYEWRWKCEDFSSPVRNLPQPRWDGCALEGSTITLYPEQGLGDTMQFIRYLPLVARRGAKIVFICQPELQRLLKPMAQGCEIVPLGQPLKAFDFQSPLLSLPRLFGASLDSIPKTVPYLQPDAEHASAWRQRLAPYASSIKVGLVWAGRPAHKNDRNRSMKLATLAPLGHVPGVHFFSLQKGEAAAEAKTPPEGLELVDWTEELTDFADTAALIANLDLVLAVDTAVVHLAGAMGKPVWTLLPFVSDWRWLVEREDSPWYPSMRLFRQLSRGDWDSVIKRVADSLLFWVKNRA
jgi:tetratricopeptide (TPR) repeat protein